MRTAWALVIPVALCISACARHDYTSSGELMTSLGAGTQTVFAGAGVAQVSAAAAESLRSKGYAIEHRADNDSEASVIGVTKGPAGKIRVICTIARSRDGASIRVSRMPSDDGAAARSLIDDVSVMVGSYSLAR